MEELSTIRAANACCQLLYCPRCKNSLEVAGDKYYCPNCTSSYPIIDGIPSFVDHEVAIDSFDASAFEFLFEMEQKHFWHVGRREMILDVLRRNIPELAQSRMLEIGCGNGVVLAYLKQNGVNVAGGDIFREGLEFCQRRVDSVSLYQIDALALPFRSDFDITGLFDVLEHIDDDERALREINQALRPGGEILLTVPAHEFLWSYFDAQSHHRRRYSKRELVAKLERNGFAIKRMSYYMCFLFPVFAAIRLVGNMFHRKNHEKKDIRTSLEAKTIPIVNEVFLGLLRLERWLIRYLDLPFGASLLVLAEKTNGK